ncbi:MOSC domain-containing protein [Polaromonas glacialis]|uniref:MOSC domain-containing protein n=1 Tax=Polaromonas glacialis TaxID=866564 RepID=UPI000495C61F|nr:MOSC N-terminal beta barrel domain-containing protein [Polaromonas glacialis]
MPDKADAAAQGKPSDLAAIITGLYVYPVKSCAGVQVQQAIVLDTGLEFDRAWMVVDGNGHFLTQRELPRMALIKPQLRRFEMILRAPGMLALHIALDQVEAPARVRIWNEDVTAFDMGPIAAQWFTDFLGVPARMVRFDPDHQRISNLDWTGGALALNQFNDGYPVLVISQASLDQFNDKLAARGFAAVGMERFRPNIVLGDAPGEVALAPHDEDRLEEFQVDTGQGPVRLKPVKPCARCPIPDIDPATAASSHEVGDTLQGYRQDARLKGAVTFGMNAIVLAGIDHLLRVGQPVGANYRFE